MALNDKESPRNVNADEALAGEIRVRLEEDGSLPCVSAIAVARTMNIDPLDVGRAADALKIRLGRCQLGLFGFPGRAKGWDAAGVAERPIPAGFEGALRAAGDPSGVLACLTIWSLADAFGLSRIQAGCVADRLSLKIVGCQLGAF